MTYYVQLDSDNRITMITLVKQNEEQFSFEFPEDFDFEQMIHYKIIDNQLVYDEFVFLEIEPQETLEQQIEMLKAENAELTLTMDSILTDIIPSLMA